MIDEHLELTCSVDQTKSEKRSVKTILGEQSNFVESDLSASNGVVHIIDKAIIPIKSKKIVI